MDPLVSLLIGAVAGLVLGALIGWLVARLAGRDRDEREDPAVLEARHQAAVAELRAQEQQARARVESELAAASAAIDGLREQVVASQQQYRDLVERTERERAERQTAAQQEGAILKTLTPVQEALRTMQQRITDMEQQRSQQHGELSQQLTSALASEERLRQTAETLASALSNNSTRGVWGEAQLRTLVESTGLLNRVHFAEQLSISTESGPRRPDMVVNLPGGKSIAVDSKVPYDAYMEASSIPATATGEEEARRASLLAKHARQVRSHVDALSAKAYWTGLETSPEFTIAFIPNEPLLAAALAQDPTLMEYAFGKRIALASPVSFWAVLQTVALTWQQEKVTAEAKQLLDLSRELYSRLSTLADRVDKLGRSIGRTVTDYNAFLGTLEQRVYPTARRLNALDEEAVLGSATPLEDAPRELGSVELITALEEESDAETPAAEPDEG